MTIPEFLERLRNIEASWQLAGGDIRCEQGDCPITRVANAIAGEKFDPALWEDAAATLDMDYEDAESIVDAADLNDEYDSDLRRALIEATVEKR